MGVGNFKFMRRKMINFSHKTCRKGTFRTLRRKYEDNIKIEVGGFRISAFGSGQGHVGRFCEHGNES
jgi:hypothetical protein